MRGSPFPSSRSENLWTGRAPTDQCHSAPPLSGAGAAQFGWQRLRARGVPLVARWGLRRAEPHVRLGMDHDQLRRGPGEDLVSKRRPTFRRIFTPMPAARLRRRHGRPGVRSHQGDGETRGAVPRAPLDEVGPRGHLPPAPHTPICHTQRLLLCSRFSADSRRCVQIDRLLRKLRPARGRRIEPAAGPARWRPMPPASADAPELPAERRGRQRCAAQALLCARMCAGVQGCGRREELDNNELFIKKQRYAAASSAACSASALAAASIAFWSHA